VPPCSARSTSSAFSRKNARASSRLSNPELNPAHLFSKPRISLIFSEPGSFSFRLCEKERSPRSAERRPSSKERQMRCTCRPIPTRKSALPFLWSIPPMVFDSWAPHARRDWRIVRCCNGAARWCKVVLDRVKAPAKSTLQRYETWVLRKKDGHKERKRVSREMKTVLTVVRAHAQRYCHMRSRNYRRLQRCARRSRFVDLKFSKPPFSRESNRNSSTRV
jgi:hypothetical protein